MQHEFIISGDHFQIYVEDENSNADTSEIWNNQTSNDMLAVASGLIAVGTIRYGGDVALTVEVLDRRPTDPLEHCDQVAECSINISSGRIVISSPEGELSKAPRITVPPGTYRALVCYSNLDSVIDENNPKGEDLYRIILWPDSSIEPVILKRRQS